MSGWPILDVAIGLSFVYLLLSTICTALTEGITTQNRSRSKFLERGLDALLGKAAKEQFLAHPVIGSFVTKDGDSPPRKMLRWLLGRFGSSKKSWARADLVPSYLPGDKFALVARELAEKQAEDGKGDLYPDLAKTVKALLKGAETELEKNKALQVWYDQVMERVSGWYKRHSQTWVRILAVIAVVALNADTIHIVDVLWRDPTVRQMAVEQAKAKLKEPAPQPVSVEYNDDDETLPDEPPTEVGTPGDSSDKHLGLSGEQWQLLNQLMSWDEDFKTLAEMQREQVASLHKKRRRIVNPQRPELVLGLVRLSAEPPRCGMVPEHGRGFLRCAVLVWSVKPYGQHSQRWRSAKEEEETKA